MKLISDITVTPVAQFGGDHMVVAAARVSTLGQEAAKYAGMTADQIQEEQSGLIYYLMRHRHGTPFEHSMLTFLVHAPIFVWREWHRHRIGFSYNEESGRYKMLEPVFYIPPRDRPMMKVGNWKPGRPKFLTLDEWAASCASDGENPTALAEVRYERLCDNLRRSYSVAYERYLDNLSLDIDPGLARDCLPVGIYSSCWVTCNPRSLMSFLSLRTHEESAKFVSYPLHEIEVAARACESVLASGWPITYKAWLANGRVGP